MQLVELFTCTVLDTPKSILLYEPAKVYLFIDRPLYRYYMSHVKYMC